MSEEHVMLLQRIPAAFQGLGSFEGIVVGARRALPLQNANEQAIPINETASKIVYFCTIYMIVRP